MSWFLGQLCLLAALQTGDVESRTHRDGDKEKWDIRFNERHVTQDGSVRFVSKGVRSDGSVSFSEKRYNAQGEPLASSQEGPWGKLESRFDEKKVVRFIDGKPHEEAVNRKDYADPTLFWFWKTFPKEGESVVVTIAAANQPSTFKIRYTYQGREEIEAAGKKVKAYKVREDPLNVNKGNEVYTLRWFDEKGMDIQRYHKVNKNEYSTKLIQWR
jgi:hypothetical protein